MDTLRGMLPGILSQEKPLSTSDTDIMNPALFPDEIQQLILSYLTVEDLLKATLVSKMWNISVGSSQTFKKRIAIRIHSWTKEVPVEVWRSERNYEIISISDFKVIKDHFPSRDGKQIWRNVTLSIGKVKSQNNFLWILERFRSVRDLRILSTNIRELSRNHSLLELPDLERLTLSDVTLDLFDLLITHQPMLKSLSMRFIICDIQSPKQVGEAIVEFLKLNPNIRDLELNYVVTNDLFRNNIAPSLKLSLKNCTIGLNETQAASQTNIEEFLKSQGSSIERLKLILHQKPVKRAHHEWGYWDYQPESETKNSTDIMIIFNVWNSMSSMRTLLVRFLNNSEEYEFKREFMRTLKPNVSITSLFMQSMSVEVPPSISIELMKLSPNLKKFYVTKLTPAIVRYAAINLKVLRELNCFQFEGECQQEYVELKASRTNVNAFIVIKDRCALG